MKYGATLERGMAAQEWLEDYTATYLERDVRRLISVGDMLTFQTFLRLCAGRTGQLLNLSSLANDCGISQPTARAWLSVLEASYIVYRLPPFFANLGKRPTKTPKLYFYDSGLAASLLNIETPRQLETHPLRGPLFETWVLGGIARAHFHRGRRPRMFFYREHSRLEIDLVLERGADLTLIEIKSARTPSGKYFHAFERLAKTLAGKEAAPRIAERIVVYGGDETQHRSAGMLLSWKELDRRNWIGGGAER